MWENRGAGSVNVSVDGTDFEIYELAPFWPGWFSHKFRGPGLCYEIGLSILSGSIVWVSGPFPCGQWTDIKIFRAGMLGSLDDGEKVVGDLGYRGEPDFVVTRRDYNENLVRARHENVNRRFKQFVCLERVFRHDVRRHSSVFRAVAVITQLGMENGMPLFGVTYDDSEY